LEKNSLRGARSDGDLRRLFRAKIRKKTASHPLLESAPGKGIRAMNAVGGCGGGERRKKEKNEKVETDIFPRAEKRSE